MSTVAGSAEHWRLHRGTSHLCLLTLSVPAPTVLAPVIAKFGPHSRLVLQSGSTFASLSRSIVYQQLAGSAADAIFKRVLLRCEVRHAGNPAQPPAYKPGSRLNPVPVVAMILQKLAERVLTISPGPHAV